MNNIGREGIKIREIDLIYVEKKFLYILHQRMSLLDTIEVFSCLKLVSYNAAK